MQKIRNNITAPILTIYSGHDTNVAPMLTFLNLTSHECVRKKYKNQTFTGNCAEPVPFASSILFELHRNDTGNEYVKIKYNGDYYQLCEKQQYECDFDEFSKRVKARLISKNNAVSNDIR